jgi:hypothetical protein
MVLSLAILGLYLAEPMLALAVHQTEEAFS